MPTTFNVIYLGIHADMDTTEGNDIAENAAALVGLTFGGFGNALSGQIQTLSPGTSRQFTQNGNTYYDQGLTNPEHFRINGGPNQDFDSTAIFDATITYLDGTTATISAVIFQDTTGRTYLAPEFSANADQVALEAGPILSLTLNALTGGTNAYLGMTGDRQAFNAVPCYVAGTLIATPSGPRPVEALRRGDPVETRDRGPQPVRWVGRATRRAVGALAPVRIAAGALGAGLPLRDLLVSPQHRMLLRSTIAARITGTAEVLVPAGKLLGLPGISRVVDMDRVSYVHFLCDHHEIVLAEGAPSETLLPGPQALAALGPGAEDELRALFPELERMGSLPARQIPTGRIQRRLVARHARNARRPLLAG